MYWALSELKLLLDRVNYLVTPFMHRVIQIGLVTLIHNRGLLIKMEMVSTGSS